VVLAAVEAMVGLLAVHPQVQILAWLGEIISLLPVVVPEVRRELTEPWVPPEPWVVAAAAAAPTRLSQALQAAVARVAAVSLTLIAHMVPAAAAVAAAGSLVRRTLATSAEMEALVVCAEAVGAAVVLTEILSQPIFRSVEQVAMA
jgi:hypothetical protein